MTTGTLQPAQLIQPRTLSTPEAGRRAPARSPVRGPVAMLTVVASLLAANLFLGALGVVGPSVAAAQPEKTVEVPFNAAEQRRQMIDQLSQVHMKLAAIEARLEKGLSVKVTEMPAVKVSSMPKPE